MPLPYTALKRDKIVKEPRGRCRLSTCPSLSVSATANSDCACVSISVRVTTPSESASQSPKTSRLASPVNRTAAALICKNLEGGIQLMNSSCSMSPSELASMEIRAKSANAVCSRCVTTPSLLLSMLAVRPRTTTAASVS